MATKHEVRFAHTADGHRAECLTCGWRSDVRRSIDLVEFLAMQHREISSRRPKAS